jgi:uncharacterized membrane protein YhaH (DUF805 family)
MSLMSFLFSFQGRVRRLHLWLFFLALSVVYGGLFWQFGHVLHVHHGGWVGGGYMSDEWLWFARSPVFDALALIAVWMKLAVIVKRWHDRDKSGWWVLIVLIPVIGWLWQLIECGFLDGTQGANKYGPSPKGL